MWQSYLQPASLPEALELLARHAGSARLVAGGTDVLVELSRGIRPAATLIDLSRLAELWSTPYGRTLALKLLLLGGVAAAGAFNWRRVRPALAGEGGGRTLRRSAALELALGALVVAWGGVVGAAPAVLWALPTPGGGRRVGGARPPPPRPARDP